MLRAMAYLAETQTQAQKAALESRNRAREKRFNIKRDVPKVAAGSAMGLVDELDYFETEFIKSQPTSGRDWAQALDENLVGQAKTWRDFAIVI